jgi:hypothetical protein
LDGFHFGQQPKAWVFLQSFFQRFFQKPAKAPAMPSSSLASTHDARKLTENGSTAAYKKIAILARAK